MEKLPHQEYRDDLADKLKEIRNSDPENPELAKAKAEGYLQGRKEDKFKHHKIGYPLTAYKEARKEKMVKTGEDMNKKRSEEAVQILSRDLEQIRKNELLGDIFENVNIVRDRDGDNYLKLSSPENTSNTIEYLLDSAEIIEANSELLPESFEENFGIRITNHPVYEMSLDSINFYMNKTEGVSKRGEFNKRMASILHQYVEKNPEISELVSRAKENGYHVVAFGLWFMYLKEDSGWKTRFYISEGFGGLPSVSFKYTFYDKDAKKIELEDDEDDD